MLSHQPDAHSPGNMRLLDLSVKHITPVMVINDGHKHLGTDKASLNLFLTLTALSGCHMHQDYSPPRINALSCDTHPDSNSTCVDTTPV